MKFTYNWLNSYIKLDVSLEKLTQTLSNIGLEIEEVLDKEKIYSQFILAEIIYAEQHPNADKLKVCKVNNGKEHLQIVCGAENARAGIKVVLASVGSVIPQNNMMIKVSKIRGVESNGMLCSKSELLLGSDSDGIIEINDEDALVYMNFADFYGLNDVIIDITLTPNRGDCASLYGIARDLAVAGMGELSHKFYDFHSDKFNFTNRSIPFKASIEDGCQEIAFCYIENIDNTSGVDKEISSIFNLLGIKSHTALVDISNFAMYEYGRPNHIYDADKIDGNIVVRMSKEGEKFISLEDKEYVLPQGILVIADDKKVLSIAGVIGGSESKVDENTKNIVVEVANFHPEQIAKSSRILNIKTESSFRFERRTDHGNTASFMQYIVKLIQKHCGGEVVGSTLLKGKELDYVKQIQLDYDEIEKILGIKIEKEKIDTILQRLGFNQEKNMLVIPTWRQGDIIDNADIAEEIIRIEGVESNKKVDYSYYAKDLRPKKVDFAELFRNVLINRNANEVVSWSFINQNYAELFADKPLIKVVNPISSELATMRCSIIPKLLQISKNNIDKGLRDLSFFEIGKIFHNEMEEENCLTVVRVGNATRKGVFSEQRKFDFYDLKDDLYSLLDEINISDDNLSIKKETTLYYHPGKSASFYIGKKLIAYVGELHPKIINEFGIKEQVCCMELFYDNLPNKNLDKRNPLFLSELPSVNRDFAFFIDDRIEGIEIIKAIKSLKIDVVDDINIFDLYKKKGADGCKKSIAFNVKLQPKDKTLVEEEIENISDKIINVIKEKLGGELRDK